MFLQPKVIGRLGMIGRYYAEHATWPYHLEELPDYPMPFGSLDACAEVILSEWWAQVAEVAAWNRQHPDDKPHKYPEFKSPPQWKRKL